MKQILAIYRAAVEERLHQLLEAPDDDAEPLFEMLQYHMGWLDDGPEADDSGQGKRVRPLLCLLACQAAGGDWHAALPAAAAVELIHNFSLIHDDIEDEGHRRRGRPTVWSRWGLAQGVNAGDAMWTVAHLAAYRLDEAGHPPALVLRAARELDRTCLALCQGQYLDLAFEERASVSPDQYMRMIEGKTASLIAASCAVGATLAGAGEEAVAAYASFGRELGLTFQIVDDILGIWGDPEVTGKSAATDLLARKKTLPVIHALEWEAERGDSRLADLYAQPELSPDDLEEALACLEDAGARGYAQNQAERHERLMLKHLESFRFQGEACQALRELAGSLLERRR